MTHRDEILAPTPEVIIDALRRTCELIEQGHCRGQAHTVIDDQDAWCLMAALVKSCATVVVWSKTETVITDEGVDWWVVQRGIIPGKAILDSCVAHLRMAISPRWSGSLSEFNDVSSKDAVVNACLRAIGLAEKVVSK